MGATLRLGAGKMTAAREGGHLEIGVNLEVIL